MREEEGGYLAVSQNNIQQKQKYSREMWKNVCQFHSHSDERVLSETLDKIHSKRAPVLLLDLDSTLYEVSPRSFQIIREWTHSSRSSGFSPVREALSQMSFSQVGYSLEDTFGHLNLDLAEQGLALNDLKKFWQDRFFTNDYLRYDRAYDGASQFVRKAYDAGAQIIYLTGRDSPGMQKGTIGNLMRDGFPWELPHVHLLMKPQSHFDDLEFKKKASQFVHEQGSLIASFENEPPNVVAFHGLFPEAMHVFVDTVCSAHQTEACHGLYRIQSYPLKE